MSDTTETGGARLLAGRGDLRGHGHVRRLLRGDFWALGWNDDNAETRKAKKLFELAKQIQADDRIAIKRS